MAKRGNPYARAVRSAVFCQRVVETKRHKVRDKEHRREMHDAIRAPRVFT